MALQSSYAINVQYWSMHTFCVLLGIYTLLKGVKLRVHLLGSGLSEADNTDLVDSFRQLLACLLDRRLGIPIRRGQVRQQALQRNQLCLLGSRPAIR